VSNRHQIQPKCSRQVHEKCENSLLCNLCDGISLYRNAQEERAAKAEAKKERQAQEKGQFRAHQKHKKDGMEFEQRVTNTWNNHFTPKKKKPVGKPRLMDLVNEEPAEEVEAPSALQRLAQSQKAPKTLTTANRPAFGTNSQKVEAKRQANSGAMWYAKGDAKLEHALLECKQYGTRNSRGEKTFSIPLEWLTKQADEAFREGRPYWYLPFAYKNDPEIYLIKPFDHEMELIQELRRLHEENESLRKQLEDRE